MAFGLGVFFFAYSVYSAIRHISEKSEGEAEDVAEYIRGQK